MWMNNEIISDENKWKKKEKFWMIKQLIYGKRIITKINMIIIFEYCKEFIILVKLIIGYYWKYWFIDNKNCICYKFLHYSLFLPKRLKCRKLS